MDAWATSNKTTTCNGNEAVVPGSKDIQVQLIISLLLGVSAFLAFCFFRPRWPSLYAARKRHNDPQIALPALPDTFLGWVPALYRVTDEQVLASAGLDAYVFLSFFKMSMRLFSVMFFFAAVVLWPINITFGAIAPTPGDGDGDGDGGDDSNGTSFPYNFNNYGYNPFTAMDDGDNSGFGSQTESNYLWAYLAFTWFFSFLVVYYLNSETFKIIKVRQEYLGTQRTITDRTFRLTGIPKDLRTEEKIKDFVEGLEIGHVKSVTLCRNWAEIDGLMTDRKAALRKLEEAWSVYLSKKPTAAEPRLRRPGQGNGDAANGEATNDDVDTDQETAREGSRLLANESLRNLMSERPRPTTRIRFGFFKMRSRQTDAIDYFEEKLRRLDAKIVAARKKEYEPQATAFVTMDSIAASQMAIQALVDPRPGELLSKPAPSPSDVVWRNTYSSRLKRRTQSWLITIFITLLTLVWVIPVIFLASLVSICTIEKVAPGFAEVLNNHELIKALVRTALPVTVVSLLNIAVPYLYDYLSNLQGTISQGDVELSVVSKNFFFTFFNVFLVFTITGSASTFWSSLRNAVNQDAGTIARNLATSIASLIDFYISFIMLQSFGLMPFRLLQFGSVTLYPIYRMGAKTPRDFAELVQPTLFNYGFYLPTALLVFILCMVYSIMPRSYLVLLVGVCYFTLGYYAYKYQLLYAMDQPQHATGGAWRIISSRIIIGLLFFQVVMLGTLSLRKAFIQAGLVAPLLVLTVWYSVYFNRRFKPLTVFVALRSLKRDSDPGPQSSPNHDAQQAAMPTRLARRMSTIDEDREKGLRFVNPSMIAPLEQPWVYQDPPPPLSPDESAVAFTDDLDDVEGVDDVSRRTPLNETNGRNSGINSGSSSFSFGDTHVWRDNGGDNV
ncbi:hypothetical protein PG994_011359 [Apiospora phragmitis]|uniref:DUF221-domain-containing protein n=1 Tax=Apiospora phragmitis TaxID=2905665 RepID=A0ABR1TSN9_9PEZI